MNPFTIKVVIFCLSCLAGGLTHTLFIDSHKYSSNPIEDPVSPVDEEALSSDLDIENSLAETETEPVLDTEPLDTPEKVAVIKEPEVKLKDSEEIKSLTFEEAAEPFFKEFCYRCHGTGDEIEGDIDLRDFASDDSIVKDRETWELILELVEFEEMPTKKPLPSSIERANFVEWLHAKLDEVDWSKVNYAGYVAMPLLNKQEYNNTMRDLLGVDLGVGHILFADGEGESGFTTDRSNLFLSPASIEKYLEAAESAVNLLEKETAAKKKVTKSRRNTKTEESDHSLNKLLQAEDMLSTGGRKSKVKGVSAVRFSVGQNTVYDSITVPVDGEYNFELRGTSYNNDNASIRVTVNGDLQANLPFEGTGYTTKKFKMFLNKGDHQIAFNKGTDANKRTEKNGEKIYHKESDLDWVRITLHKAQSEEKLEKAEKKIIGTPLYSFKPAPGLSENQSVRNTLTHFLLRSFRRPVDEEILKKYLTLYSSLRKQGATYSFALKQAMVSIMVSPRFLYRNELATDDLGDANEYALDDFQIASRLSYYLWLSMPDKELFKLAATKKLRDPDVLRQQVKRMLADPKSRDFSSAFLGQWLGFSALGKEVNPDAETFPEFDEKLANAMKAETILTFEHLIAKDFSLLTLIDSKATYLNEDLANHYGIDGIKGDQMRPILLTDKQRGGLLGMGSILTATSSPTRTSPVLRGIWVLERLLGERIPEAPADVPEIDAKVDQQKSTTLRKELEHHRDNPNCARCHDKIDPIGFGLENFDALGRFRTEEASGNPIDSSGEMEGHKFRGAAELKKWILENRKEEFIRTISEKMLAFAIGRKIEPFDEAAIQKITNALKENDYKASILMQEVVLSHPFLNKGVNKEIKINE